MCTCIRAQSASSALNPKPLYTCMQSSIITTAAVQHTRCSHGSALIMESNLHALQVLAVDVTYDKRSFGYGELDNLHLTCLRSTDSSTWKGPQAFSRVCAAHMDIASLPAGLPAHPWDHTLPSHLKDEL